MKASELRHISYAIKIACVVLPLGLLSMAIAGVIYVVLFPVQLPAWLFGGRTFVETAPYRPVIQSRKRIEKQLERFAGNPWTDPP